MKRWILLVALLCGTWALAQESQMKGFRLRLFDAAGKPTHLVTGDASGLPPLMKLTGAEVQFLPRDQPTGEPVARVFLDAANWLTTEQVATGEGEVRFRSPQGNITGKGYRYDLEGDRLAIRDGFRIELPEGVVTGREADVTLGRLNGEVVIDAFEARADIVFTPKVIGKDNIERVGGERAWYAGTDDLLRIASPLRPYHKDGSPGKLEFDTYTHKLGLRP